MIATRLVPGIRVDRIWNWWLAARYTEETDIPGHGNMYDYM